MVASTSSCKPGADLCPVFPSVPEALSPPCTEQRGAGPCPISGATGTAPHEPVPEILTAGLVASTEFPAHLFSYPCRSLLIKSKFSEYLREQAQATMLFKSCYVAIAPQEQERRAFPASSLPYALMALLPAALPQPRRGL